MYPHHFLSKTIFFLFIFGQFVATSPIRADPPNDMTKYTSEDDTTILSLGISSITIPLRGLEVGNTDLEMKCAELSLLEKRRNKNVSPYIAVSGCFKGDISGAEGEGEGLKGKLGYLGVVGRAYFYIDIDAFQITFSDNPTGYEIGGAALNAGFMFAPFDRSRSNIFISNLLLGAEYSYTNYSEEILDANDIETDNELSLKKEFSLLARWGYTSNSGLGVSVSGSFVSQNIIEFQIHKSF